jgi:hypothetical protein
MKKMKRYLTISLAVLALLAPASIASAGEASGHNLVVSDPPAITELPNGTVYTAIRSRQVCTTTDPGHPLNRASGDCAGGCVADAEGNETCMGSCTWVDMDGDLAFFNWTGKTDGNWWLKGGTGKYAGGSGEGTWVTDAVYAGEITGNSFKGTMDLD